MCRLPEETPSLACFRRSQSCRGAGEAAEPASRCERRAATQGASVRSLASKPVTAGGRRFVISERHLSSVLRPTDRPYGEVFRVFDFEVSSKCASGEPEIVPSRELELVPRELKSRELPRRFRPSSHSSIFSLGVTLNQIFQWQYYEFY